jgi:hypothetical protein
LGGDSYYVTANWSQVKWLCFLREIGDSLFVRGSNGLGYESLVTASICGPRARPLLVCEEVLIDLLQIKGLIDPNTDIVPHHQGSKTLSIDKSPVTLPPSLN